MTGRDGLDNRRFVPAKSGSGLKITLDRTAKFVKNDIARNEAEVPGRVLVARDMNNQAGAISLEGPDGRTGLAGDVPGSDRRQQ